MKLTTRSRYGTQLLLDIAMNGQDRPVPIGNIARRQGLPVKYLEKLIRELRGAGYVKSKRGSKGGHMLAKPANEITVGEIVQVLDGDASVLECEKDYQACQRVAVCLRRSIWHDARVAMYNKLNSFTLADLIRDASLCPIYDQS